MLANIIELQLNYARGCEIATAFVRACYSCCDEGGCLSVLCRLRAWHYHLCLPFSNAVQQNSSCGVPHERANFQRRLHSTKYVQLKSDMLVQTEAATWSKFKVQTACCLKLDPRKRSSPASKSTQAVRETLARRQAHLLPFKCLAYHWVYQSWTRYQGVLKSANEGANLIAVNDRVRNDKRALGERDVLPCAHVPIPRSGDGDSNCRSFRPSLRRLEQDRRLGQSRAIRFRFQHRLLRHQVVSHNIWVLSHMANEDDSRSISWTRPWLRLPQELRLWLGPNLRTATRRRGWAETVKSLQKSW
jgi:hypothetical protein